ncbi:MAG TPA: ABC transporter permease subunit [Planctomycetota bacterium]|nr:ABC transporter permease subunit [Planctomycetota bacterium]
MPKFLTDLYDALNDPKSTTPAIVLVWAIVLAALTILIWPRGRTIARQIYALASLGFREGLRLKILWTVFALALIPGVIAYCSDADGTHAGRARLILDTCIASGELLGASLIVLLSALSVAREIESRIMHTMGAKPVPRWAILAGKAFGFCAIDLCFLAVLLVFSAGLVRAVPWRAETRGNSKLDEAARELTAELKRGPTDSEIAARLKLAPSEFAALKADTGSWSRLVREALTTRTYAPAKASEQGAHDLRVLNPLQTQTWTLSPPPGTPADAQRSLVLSINGDSFQPTAKGVRITVHNATRALIFDRTESIPLGRAFQIFLDPQKTEGGEIEVAVTAPAHDPSSNVPPTKLVISRNSSVKLGVAADGFAANLLKSFLLMAIQGWVLAIITASWSGVLSFPVTVALGVLFVLSGEMSRNVIELMQNDSERLKELAQLGVINAQNYDYQMQSVARLKTLLGLFPDFRAAGGPAAFVDGTYVPNLALAHTALWVGLLRGIGWALPGFVAFQRREVGK